MTGRNVGCASFFVRWQGLEKCLGEATRAEQLTPYKRRRSAVWGCGCGSVAACLRHATAFSESATYFVISFEGMIRSTTTVSSSIWKI